MVCVGEKGYVTTRLTVAAEPGHASLPPNKARLVPAKQSRRPTHEAGTVPSRAASLSNLIPPRPELKAG
jgi:acetylornithine deacetylase/succinyl-diaminopimelate desuccinylase-like protein